MKIRNILCFVFGLLLSVGLQNTNASIYCEDDVCVSGEVEGGKYDGYCVPYYAVPGGSEGMSCNAHDGASSRDDACTLDSCNPIWNMKRSFVYAYYL